jgi:hypothetical protein
MRSAAAAGVMAMEDPSASPLDLATETYIQARQARAYAVVALAFEQPSAQNALRLEALRQHCASLEKAIKRLTKPLSINLRMPSLEPITEVLFPLSFVLFFPLSISGFLFNRAW